MGLCLQLPQLGVGCWESAVRYRKWGQGGRRFSALSGSVLQSRSSCGSWVSGGGVPGRMLHLPPFPFQGVSVLCTPKSCPEGVWGVAHLDSGIWKSGVPQSRHNELDLLLIEALTFFRFVIAFGQCHRKTCLHILPNDSAELWSFTCVESSMSPKIFARTSGSESSRLLSSKTHNELCTCQKTCKPALLHSHFDLFQFRREWGLRFFFINCVPSFFTTSSCACMELHAVARNCNLCL